MNISIAMATYNGAKYIREQLASLAAQTWSPYELVVTDDGSTDETMTIVEEFARTALFPVKYHRNSERLGFADNFLRAASLCEGDWIAFCDQDDVWLANKLERCGRELCDSRIVLLAHSGKVVDDRLNAMGWDTPSFSKNETIKSLSSKPWGVYAGFSMIVRRDILDLIDKERRPNHPHLPASRQSHDQWVYFLASIFGDTRRIKDSLVLYRQHSSNTYGVTRAKKKLTLHQMLSSSVGYLRCASTLAGKHADILLSESSCMPQPLADKALLGASYYKRLQTWLSCRGGIHDSNSRLPRRIALLFKLAITGGYRSEWRGGVGIRPLLKDSIICLFGVSFLQRLFGYFNSEIKSR